MKHLGRLATYVLLALNLLVIGLLLFSAYSPHINPEVHALRACMGLAFPVFLFANVCFLCCWLIFRWRLVVLPVLAFLICAPQIRTYIPFNLHTKDVPQEAIKVLSYNVMAFDNLKKVDGKNPILTYLEESNADIICLQEYMVVSKHKYVTEADVQKALKAYPYRHIQKVGRDKSSNTVACFSKYPIVSARRIMYDSYSNGSAMYDIAVGGDTITVINNHLESNKLTRSDKEVYVDMIKNPEANKVKEGTMHLIGKLGDAQRIRAQQADVVAKAVADTPYPYVIVCGDFNDSPISYTHRVISETLDDAFVNSGSGLGISYNQNGFYFRIDHILMSRNLKAYNCTVDRSIKNSDHYPIWCYIAKR